MKNDYFNLILDKVHLKSLKAFKILLRRFFGFDRWHLVTYLERQYVFDIVQHLNDRDIRDSALEIGCGLGDIIKRLDYDVRVGLDREREVLSALRFTNKIQNFGSKSINLSVFDFEKDTVLGKYDVIIMCNWIHNIEPEFLKIKVEELLRDNLIAGGELILDIVENKSYRYNHSQEHLYPNISVEIKVIGNYEHGRKVLSFKKKD
ncbi:class I SAM-dependent methyltransferase [bacterium]|nr:class I SAM-dependent methyltransferase [bacterium]